MTFAIFSYTKILGILKIFNEDHLILESEDTFTFEGTDGGNYTYTANGDLDGVIYIPFIPDLILDLSKGILT